MNNSVIWSKDGCVYCLMAKRLISSKNIKFEERNIDEGVWTKEQMLVEAPDAKTFPQIFLHGKYVGGYDDLLKYVEDHGMYTND